MEADQREELKSSLPLLGNFVVLLLITIVRLDGNAQFRIIFTNISPRWNRSRRDLVINLLRAYSNSLRFVNEANTNVVKLRFRNIP